MDYLIGILKEEPLLGVIPDQMIAGKYGVTTSVVARRRRKLGIKASDLHLNIHLRRLKLAETLPELGKMSDAEIARQQGVTRERIRQLRKKLGIPKYSGKEKAA